MLKIMSFSFFISLIFHLYFLSLPPFLHLFLYFLSHTSIPSLPLFYLLYIYINSPFYPFLPISQSSIFLFSFILLSSCVSLICILPSSLLPLLVGLEAHLQVLTTDYNTMACLYTCHSVRSTHRVHFAWILSRETTLPKEKVLYVILEGV